MRPTAPGALTLAAALALGVACAKGPLPGRLIVPGRTPEAVALHYRTGVLGATGELWTTLPDGERFTGDYRLEPRNPEGKMTSVLTGSAGTTMACTFRFREPGTGPHGGGTYSCDLSTGGVMQGQF